MNLSTETLLALSVFKNLEKSATFLSLQITICSILRFLQEQKRTIGFNIWKNFTIWVKHVLENHNKWNDSNQTVAQKYRANV